MQSAGVMLCAAGLHMSVMAGPRPERIVSTNVCTDQLLLLLADRDRIAALSNLSEDPALSNMAEAANGLRKNGARAEEIVPLKPDLVLANQWTGATANRFLQGLGIDVFVVPDARSFAEIEATLQRLGARLGEPQRAAALVENMRVRLAAAARRTIAGTALVYEPNGYTPSRGTLSDAVLEAAGWTNLAPQLGVVTYGVAPLERVVMTRPDLLIFDGQNHAAGSRAQALLQHPALRSVAKTAEVMQMPGRLWLCAGPWTVEAVERLAKIERRP
jgi:iron complex transport system substrate-binding protein